MKETYVLDTIGTTVPLEVTHDLNRLFFKYAESLGYPHRLVAELCALFERNPIDPGYLVRSAEGKAKLLREKLYTAHFYPDVKPFFERMRGTGNDITIFSKGGYDTIIELYRQGGLLSLVGEENILSSSLFTVSDKRDPRCYKILNRKLAERNQSINSYTSDDSLEAAAFARAFPSKNAFLVARGQTVEALSPNVTIIKSLDQIL